MLVMKSQSHPRGEYWSSEQPLEEAIDTVKVRRSKRFYLPEVFHQHSFSEERVPGKSQLPIARPLKIQDCPGLEVRNLDGRAACDRLLPNVAHVADIVEERNRLFIRHPR